MIPFKVHSNIHPSEKFVHLSVVHPAERAKAAALAGECQQGVVNAVLTFHTGKAMTKVAAVEVTVEHFFDIRPPETVFLSSLLQE